MNVQFTARHFSASSNLKGFASESVKKLTKFYEGIHDCDIIAEPNEDPDKPQQIEIKLNVPGSLLAATETAETYEKAINLAVDNLKRQLKKHKEKNSR